MQLIEPIIVVKSIEAKVGQAPPSEVISWLIRIGYSTAELKNQKTFEAAEKDLINQIRYN